MGVDFDLIFGLHSIAAALGNTRRVHQKLVATDEGLAELQKKHRINAKTLGVKIELLASHALQESAKKLCQYLDVEFTRVPGQIYLQTSHLKLISCKIFSRPPRPGFWPLIKSPMFIMVLPSFVRRASTGSRE